MDKCQIIFYTYDTVAHDVKTTSFTSEEQMSVDILSVILDETIIGV